MSNQTISPGALLAGRYRIAELLTEIDGARAWRATDEVLGRSVVLDVLASDDPRSARLHDAARRAAAAADSRFLRVLDCDVLDGLTYCVREFAGGRPLERMLGAGPITGQQAGWLTREVSEALENLHRTGLHHGSISPSTVIITDSGSVKVLGVATEAVLRSLGPGAPEHDVRDLGAVLYASLTARWPGGPAYGLQPAPVEHGRLLSPRQVRAGVPRSLDDIADRLLGNPPRHHAAPVTSAAGLTAALSGVIGRSHEPPSQLTDETVAVAQLNGSVDDAATVMVPVIDEPPALDPPSPPLRAPNPNGAPPRRRMQEASYDASPTARPVRRQPPGNGNGRGDNRHGSGGRRKPPKEERGGGWGGRILILLAILALLSVIAMAQFLARDAFRTDQKDKDDPKTTASTPPASKAIKIVGGLDFDPEPEGNGEEHPEDVPKTFDGKQNTTWTTMSYKRRPDLGGSKDGVGIIYDLGAVTDVSQVTVTLRGEPTDLELRIPEDDTAQSPPKLDGWKSVTKLTESGEAAVLKPPNSVKTRYLLVWLTKLPKAGNGYRGEIAEVTVQR